MLYNLLSTAAQTKTSVPVNEVLLAQIPFVLDPVYIYTHILKKNPEVLNIWFTTYNYFKSKKEKNGYLNELSFKQIQTLITCFLMKHLLEKTAAVHNMLLSSHQLLSHMINIMCHMIVSLSLPQLLYHHPGTTSNES